MKTQKKLLANTRTYMLFIIIGLALSGVTAFPLETETTWLANITVSWNGLFSDWLKTIAVAITETNKKFPYLSYGTDWLAFAHLMLAVLFIGPFRNPVRNKWIVEFGIICCFSIIPLALIAGDVRQIPIFWRLVDCSFGLIALLPLGLSLSNIKKLEKFNSNESKI